MRGRFARALPTVSTVLAIALFVTAGNWQRGRMHQKLALGEQLAAAESAPAAPLPASDVDWMTWRYRIVDAVGQYDAQRQILIDNRVHGGRVGYHVVTTLVVDERRAMLVNRGFVPAGQTREALPSVPPPSGNVRVRGRINPSPGQYLELGAAGPQRGVWQNLDPARFSAVTGLAVLPLVIEQVEGPADGLVRDWPRPESGADKHKIYMMQWYAFAALAGALWAWFTLRRRRAA